MKYRIKINPNLYYFRYEPQFKKAWFHPWRCISLGEQTIEEARNKIEELKSILTDTEITI